MASTYKRGEKGKEIYWGRLTRHGVERRRSLRTTSAKVARERLDAWVAQVEGEGFGQKTKHTFDEAAVKFIDEHLPTIKPKSRKRYGTSIANLTPFLKGRDLAQIGSAELNEFVSARRREVIVPNMRFDQTERRTDKTVSPPTIRRDLACLSSIYGMAIEWEWVDVNPVGPFLRRMRRRWLKESQPRTRYLTKTEEAALIEHAHPDVAKAITFAIATGLRKEEQFALDWSAISLDPAQVRVSGSTSKNARDRSVPLMPAALKVLEGLPRSDRVPHVFWHMDLRRSRKPRRLNTMDRGLKAAARRAGIKDLRWHDLRRTCGCRLLQDHRASMETVSKWLGHSSVKVTEASYAFLTIEHLHRAIQTVDISGHSEIVA